MLKFIRQTRWEVFDVSKLRSLMLSPVLSLWYYYLSRVDRDGEVLFLNYGFANGEAIDLHEADEVNRYSIQLYHYAVREIDLADKKILEIGCGKGGGAAYISRYFEPELFVGVDRSREGIKFNNRYYQDNKLYFIEGNAHAIPFPENSFDVVLNVESSHLYLDFNKFLSEVKRVMKPGGYFLFADFRLKNQVQPMFRYFEYSGLDIIEKEDITKNIIQALDLDFKRRDELVKKMLPKFLHKWAMYFSGVKDTGFYKSFKNGGRKYFSLILRNPTD